MEIRSHPLGWSRRSCRSLPTFDLVHPWDFAKMNSFGDNSSYN